MQSPILDQPVFFIIFRSYRLESRTEISNGLKRIQNKAVKSFPFSLHLKGHVFCYHKRSLCLVNDRINSISKLINARSLNPKKESSKKEFSSLHSAANLRTVL